jgi:hypothetical protein
MSARLGSRRKRSRKCSLFVPDHGNAWLCVCRGGTSADAQGSARPRAFPPARRREPQIRPCLFARLDARAHENLQRLRLLERIDRVVADPHEFEAGLVHADVDHVVEGVLSQRLSGTRPSCVACWRMVSPVARFTWLTNGETGTEKA